MILVNVSLIIPALNEEATIAAAIERAWAAGADQVVVVDGGSTDATVATAREHGCQLVTSPRGRGTQQNRGAAQATGDVLLFVHADNWLAPGSVAQIRESLTDPRVAWGSFQQRIDATGWAYRVLERGNSIRARWFGLPYGDQALFVGRKAFAQCGGFPEISLMEDVVLASRLRRCGRHVQLPGPLFVSARRWQRQGVVRTTLRNWALLTAYRLGVPPRRLAEFYPPAGGERGR